LGGRNVDAGVDAGDDADVDVDADADDATTLPSAVTPVMVIGRRLDSDVRDYGRKGGS